MSASVDVLALVKWQERGKLTPFVGSSHGWTHRAVITLSACLMASGCVGDTAQPRRPSTDAGSARLSGTWAITLRLERPASLATDAKRLPRNVEGTVMLLEDHDAARSFAEMKDPTYIGVYDIDLDSLELPPWDAYVLPGIAAHAGPGRARPDSVFLVINPTMTGHAVRLSGVLEGNQATGTWTADSPLGGGGTFTLRRRKSVP